MSRYHEKTDAVPDFELPQRLQDFLEIGLDFAQNKDDINRELAEAGRSDLLIEKSAVVPAVKSPDDVLALGVHHYQDDDFDTYREPDLTKGNNFPVAFAVPGPNGSSINLHDLHELRDGIYVPKPTIAFPRLRPFVERMLATETLREFTEDLILKMSSGQPHKIKYLYGNELYVANQIAAAGMIDTNDPDVKKKDGSINERILTN